LNGDVVAFAVPHNDVISGTWGGDILLNSNVVFSSVDQVFRVALHEMGHVLGLGESTDPTSVMFDQGLPKVTAPSSSDIAALERLYGMFGGEREDQLEGETSDDNLASAIPLQVSPGFLNAIQFDVDGSISQPSDVDYYRLNPQNVVLSDLEVLTVHLETVSAKGLMPHVDILSAAGKVVESKILSNGNGELVVQTDEIVPGQSYLVRVRPEEPSGNYSTGDYHLSARFGSQVTASTRLAGGLLNAAAPHNISTLHVEQTSLMHLVLSAGTTESTTPMMVWVVISDSQGKVVARLATKPRETRSAPEFVLAPGDYRIDVQAGTPSGKLLPSISFSLRGSVLSLPIGIDPVDPTADPSIIINPTTDITFTDSQVTTPVIYADTSPPPDAPADPGPPPWDNPDWLYLYLLGMI
jgi:hypothetical protein